MIKKQLGIMKKMKKKSFKIGSVTSGVGLGILLGIWMNYIYSFPGSLIVYISTGAFIFGFLGSTVQKTTETLAYAVSIYVFLQIAWDWACLDRGEIRLSLLIVASLLMISNIITGHYNLKKPVKIFLNALGISKK